MSDLQPQANSSVRVTTLELFFDLVFVFTITQVTGLVVKANSTADFYQVFLALALTWWMFAGYVWLTNNINVQLPIFRVLILAAMAGFLVMALAIPKILGDGGLAFGLGYLLVVLIHLGLFTQSANASSVRAIWGVAPYNLSAAALVLVSGLVGEPWNLWLRTGALLILLSTLFRRAERGFVINPSHFAERHGLVVLIVLGESLIAIGTGAEKEPIGPLLLLAAVLALALSAALWWSYFDRDDARAEHALTHADPDRRVQLAGIYGYAHLLMIGGIVVMSAGIKQVIAHLHEPYPAAAWSLGVGIALYLLGDVWFRRMLGIGQGWLRLSVGVLALTTVWIGLSVGGLAQLGALVALLVMMLVIEQTRNKKLERQLSSP